MKQPEIIIYSSANCPYCMRAKQYLDSRDLSYVEIRIDLDSNMRTKMMEITGRRTVPQIFINKQHIGGCDDLMALAAAGKIDELLLTKQEK